MLCDDHLAINLRGCFSSSFLFQVHIEKIDALFIYHTKKKTKKKLSFASSFLCCAQMEYELLLKNSNKVSPSESMTYDVRSYDKM